MALGVTLRVPKSQPAYRRVDELIAFFQPRRHRVDDPGLSLIGGGIHPTLVFTREGQFPSGGRRVDRGDKIAVAHAAQVGPPNVDFRREGFVGKRHGLGLPRPTTIEGGVNREWDPQIGHAFDGFRKTCTDRPSRLRIRIRHERGPSTWRGIRLPPGLSTVLRGGEGDDVELNEAEAPGFGVQSPAVLAVVEPDGMRPTYVLYGRPILTTVLGAARLSEIGIPNPGHLCIQKERILTKAIHQHRAHVTPGRSTIGGAKDMSLPIRPSFPFCPTGHQVNHLDVGDGHQGGAGGRGRSWRWGCWRGRWDED